LLAPSVSTAQEEEVEVVVVEKVESIGVDGVVSTRSIHRRGVGGWVGGVCLGV